MLTVVGGRLIEQGGPVRRRPIGRVVWVAIAVGLTLGTVVLLDWSTLGSLWGRWWHGSVADERLWALPMFWWGRIGKFLQFFAGLTIVLDVIGPERLRRWGEHSADRVRAAGTRARTSREAARLLDQLGTAETRVKRDLALIGTDRLRLSELDDPPADLDMATYRALLTEVLDAFDGNVDCGSCHASTVVKAPYPTFVVDPKRPARKWNCVHGRGVLEPLVEAAVAGGWTAEEDAAFRSSARIHRRTVGITSILAVLLVGIVVVAVVVDVPPILVPVLIPVLYVVFVFLSALAILGSEPGAERVTGSTLVGLWAAVQRVPSLLARTIAYLLHRSRPGRPILAVAVLLLVAGVHFDLLAS